MRHFAMVGAALLVACSEYDVVDDYPPTGDPNPPGVEEDVQVDRVVQSTIAAVDVLWVIDNSCSMSDEQTRLTEQFDDFMAWFQGSELDYHIGVISTDVTAATESGRLQRGGDSDEYLFIEPSIEASDDDPVAVFATMATLGVGGDASERGRDAVFAALDAATGIRDTDNAGFYRDEASLAVIVISDENDYSQLDVEPFITWFRGLKPDPEMLSFSSIVGPEDLSGGACPGATETGTEYLEVTRAVGGVEWSICQADWAPALEQLGMEAAGLRREFFLTELPVVDSIRVWVEVGDVVAADLVRGDDYTYDASRNSVRLLTYTPAEMSEVFIEYEVRSTSWPDEVE